MKRTNSRYIDAFLRDCKPDGLLLTEGLGSAPLCSVNCGGAGIALLLYKLNRDRGDAELLFLADIWIKVTARSLGEPYAFHNPDLGFTEAMLGKSSLLNKESGIRCVQALVARALNNKRACRAAVEAFLTLSKLSGKRHELSLGKGGILVGCALLIDALRTFDAVLCEKLRVRGEQIYHEMAALPQNRLPKANQKYLGIAHGQAGILYALLVWHDISGRTVAPKLSAALKKLAESGQKIRSGARWPVARGSHDYWSGWCNGTAGYVFLWTLTARLLFHSDYLDLAEMAAEHTWQMRNANPSLCCGAAGDGYAYLNLYRATGKEIWLQRAKKAAEAATKIDTDDYSLFKGRAGVVALLGDLEQPKDSWMPLFERPNK